MRSRKIALKFFALALVSLSVHAANAEEATATEAPAPNPIPAATPPQAKTAGHKGPAVLDFEADVIEGERKSPSLFLQLETETTDLDTLLYQRSNFNDFHSIEKTRRPIYRKPSP